MTTSESSTAKSGLRNRALAIGGILFLSILVRCGTAYFLIEHIEDPSWFQFGSYSIFHQRAERILDGTEPVFFISDPTRTDLLQYPPGYPVLLAAVYLASGDHSAAGTIRIQWLLDAVITPLLLIGIAVSAFGWRSGYVAGVFAAIAPLLALYGVTPNADAAASWPVLVSFWLLILALKRESWRIALCSGLVLGVSCWIRVNPVFLVVVWAGAVPIIMRANLRKAFFVAGALAFGTLLLTAPITIRNYVVFGQFVPNGLSVGVNLWEGLGETEYGRSRGFFCSDQLMIESERAELGLDVNAPLSSFWPDGIRRDSERARKALAVMGEHPVWYAGVMATRAWYMVKLAGEPGQFYGSSGFNCTSSKCLPLAYRIAPLTWGVAVLGSIQSVYRFAAMPLALLGLVWSFRRHPPIAILTSATVLYYLGPGTLGHTEIRYVLPMHQILIVLSGFAAVSLFEWVGKRVESR